MKEILEIQLFRPWEDYIYFLVGKFILEHFHNVNSFDLNSISKKLINYFKGFNSYIKKLSDQMKQKTKLKTKPI